MGYYSPCGCQQPDTPERLNSDTATTTATMESVTVRTKWEISCCLVFSSFLLSLILELRGISQLTLMGPTLHLKVVGLLTSRDVGGDSVRTSLPRRLSDFVFGEEAVFHLLGSEAVRLLGNI